MSGLTLDVLKRMEWVGDGSDDDSCGWCPCCDVAKPYGHASTCELAAEIARLEAPSQARHACGCSCCNHRAGTDCACECHMEGECVPVATTLTVTPPQVGQPRGSDKSNTHAAPHQAAHEARPNENITAPSPATPPTMPGSGSV